MEEKGIWRREWRETGLNPDRGAPDAKDVMIAELVQALEVLTDQHTQWILWVEKCDGPWVGAPPIEWGAVGAARVAIEKARKA